MGWRRRKCRLEMHKSYLLLWERARAKVGACWQGSLKHSYASIALASVYTLPSLPAWVIDSWAFFFSWLSCWHDSDFPIKIEVKSHMHCQLYNFQIEKEVYKLKFKLSNEDFDKNSVCNIYHLKLTVELKHRFFSVFLFCEIFT